MRKKNEHHVISNSTILILSGFLIGLTVGKMVSESLSPYVLACGLSGFLAFIALEFTGTRREEEEAHSEQVQVQSRLDRHVMPLSHLGFVLSEEAAAKAARGEADSTYITIDQKRLDALYERLMKIDASSDSQIFDHAPADKHVTKVS
jgi:LDH2 family malate/lactate/ureidoglycolate dehydrogenase